MDSKWEIMMVVIEEGRSILPIRAYIWFPFFFHRNDYVPISLSLMRFSFLSYDNQLSLTDYISLNQLSLIDDMSTINQLFSEIYDIFSRSSLEENTLRK